MVSVINFQARKYGQASDRGPYDNCVSDLQSCSSDKKVGFLDTVQFNDHPSSSSFNAEQNCSRTGIRSTVSLAKSLPLKGILKPSNGYTQLSVKNMLQSHLKALAGSDIYSRSDAYVNLSNMIRAFDDTPDSQNLVNNISELGQYIERDLVAVNENGKPNSTLISQALALVISLQYNPSIAESFPTKFSIFLVEFAIKSLEDPLISRDIKKNVMFMMAHQNFSPKVITSERLRNLIISLNSPSDKIEGRNFFLRRLEIYRHLLKSSKSLMIVHTAWIGDLLCDMNSSLQAVQISAIKVGFQAAVELGSEASVTGALCTLFKSKLNDDELYGTTYLQILMNKARQKEQAVFVPQIWSVLILLQRYKSQILAQSSHMKSFLAALTLCFNQKDVKVQKQAQYAWNRFIYAVQLSEKTPKPMREILIRPCIQSILNRKSNHISGCFFNLLYYAFRPGCSTSQLDLYWDEFVIVLISQSLGLVESNRIIDRDVVGVVLKILVNIFDIKTPRRWTEKKAVESFGPNEISADELPALDSKWLRKNTTRAFSALLNILNRLFWDFSDPSSTATKVWENYINSVASPAAVEIKVSLETMSCISNIFEFLNHRWDSGIHSSISLSYLNRSQDSHEFLLSIQTIICITISGLGALSFTEKLLHLSQGKFSPVSSTHQNSLKTKILCRSPIAYLLIIFSKSCPGLEYDFKFGEMIDSVLKLVFEPRKNLSSLLELVIEIFQIIPEDEILIQLQVIWESLSKQLISSMVMSNSKGQKIDGEIFSKIVEVLKMGIKVSPKKPLRGWISLFEFVTNSISVQAGYSGGVIDILEPISEVLLQFPNELLYVETLISKVEYAKDLMALEPIHRKLCPIENLVMKNSSSYPCVQFYKYLKNSLIIAYDLNHENTDIISSTNNFLSRCPDEQILDVLIHLKDGIIPWIIDRESKLSNELQFNAVLLLWTTINSSLLRAVEYIPMKKKLHDLETMIASGLESKNRNIVEMTVETWDAIFSNFSGDLEYFKHLQNMLHSFRLTFSDSNNNSASDRSNISNKQAKEVEFENTDDQLDDKSLTIAKSKLNRENQRLSTSPKNAKISTPQVIIRIKNLSGNSQKEKKEPLKTCAKNPEIQMSDHTCYSIQPESEVSPIKHNFVSQKLTRNRRQKASSEDSEFTHGMEMKLSEESNEIGLSDTPKISISPSISDFCSSQQSISIEASKLDTTSDRTVLTNYVIADDVGHISSLNVTSQVIQHDLSISTTSFSSPVICSNESLRMSTNFENLDVTKPTVPKIQTPVKQHNKLHPQKSSSMKENTAIQSSLNKEIDNMEFAETQDTDTPFTYEGRVYNYSSSAESVDVITKANFSNVESPEHGKSPYRINVKTKSLKEKENENKNNKYLINTQELYCMDDISSDETSLPKPTRLQGISSSPVSLTYSSSRLNLKPNIIKRRTGSLSPSFQFTDDSSAIQSYKSLSKKSLSLLNHKDIGKDKNLNPNLTFEILGKDPKKLMALAKTLAPYDSLKQPPSPLKSPSRTEFFNESQPPSKQISNTENNQFKIESPKKGTLARHQSNEILGSGRISRSLTRKRKLSVDNKKAHHIKGYIEQESKEQLNFKRRKTCKDSQVKDIIDHEKLDVRPGISVNNEISDDYTRGTRLSKSFPILNTKKPDSKNNNQNSLNCVSNAGYSENNEYKKPYRRSTRSRVIRPNRSPVVTRNLSSNSKKTLTLTKRLKQRSTAKNSLRKEKKDVDARIFSTSLTNLQQQLEKLESSEPSHFSEDEFDLGSNDKSAVNACSVKNELSNYPNFTSRSNPKPHQRNDEKSLIMISSFSTTSSSSSSAFTTANSNQISGSESNKSTLASNKSANKTVRMSQNPPIHSPVSNHNNFCRDIILGKLGLLISAINQAELRKADISLIEDKMMDAKRALYEAERRGRLSS
ncbi:putative telomere length regulator protein [Erysiphe necator]|uniref:Putative telomere length regulator protein n=1 Tax=Uncinula necator TaxID=52586 RepID=A0A0B1P1W8_UNCNE|nr:putative telomere length regulator protein [Erysiphe necator]